jgi:CubicO group peptidase (beta-lactamase class C family)
MTARIFLLLAILTFSGGEGRGQEHRWPEQALAGRIDAYLQPYVQSGNFSGVVLAKQNGKLLFFEGYGFADRANKVPNTPATRFHVASVSMQFTAAAVLRLVDEGKLGLDTPVGEFVPGIRGAEKIIVRDLLTERSGLPDINSFPEYNDLLGQHQTPASLVAKIDGQPLLFEPGTRFLHEEHSAYNLLALLVEKKTGWPFAAAVERLVFRPAGLRSSQVDDDSIPASKEIAIGYQPEGTYGLKRATTIHWSGKTGNASVVMTAEDEAKWVDTLIGRKFLSASSREAALDRSPEVGYGWFKRANKRFDEMTYFMNGRAPGFGSFVLYLPREKVTVVVFGNIYSSATTAIGYDLAAMVRSLPYRAFHTSDPPPSAGELASSTGTFRFGQDFYQPNAEVALITNGQELSLRWPGGSLSPLLPVGKDQFVDRTYWEQIQLERDTKGQLTGLAYGSFHGRAVRDNPH